MSIHRVTEQSLMTTSMIGLQGNLNRLQRLQEQMTSGKLIARPSDSPGGTIAAMQLRGDLRLTGQYARNANDGIGWLGTLDGTMTNMVDDLQRVRDLMVQGMSAGTSDVAGAREAMATEIDNLRGALLTTVNTRYLDRPVFGGTTAGSEAYDVNGNYVGDSGAVYRTVADGTRVRVDSSGPDVFGTGATGVFGLLSSVSASLRANNPASMAPELDDMDVAIGRVSTELASVGTRYNELMQLGQTATDRQTTLTSQLSDIEDIDLPKTITDLQLQQTAYQAALSATAKVLQPSLVDFLR
jgi:flagellar hook-associated protein 3 FlgL